MKKLNTKEVKKVSGGMPPGWCCSRGCTREKFEDGRSAECRLKSRV
jgi:hypothetical protein